MSIKPNCRRLLSLVGVVLLALGASARAGTIYETDFSNFPQGDDQLVGHDGWTGTASGTGVQGIGEFVPGLGNSAYIGFGNPTTAVVSVGRRLDYDPLAAGTPVIDFYAVLGMNDSTTSRRDVFSIVFFNRADDLLAAIILDNTNAATAGFDVLSFDGEVATETGSSFAHGEVYELIVRIDFARNRWSALLDGIPIFAERPFTAMAAAAAPRDLGSIDVEWQVDSPPAQGDNWLLFDDWTVSFLDPPLPEDPPVITGFERHADGSTTLQWEAAPGAASQVEYSCGLTSWSSDLPGALIPRGQGGLSSFTDTGAVGRPQRYYRVRYVDSP